MHHQDCHLKFHNRSWNTNDVRGESQDFILAMTFTIEFWMVSTLWAHNPKSSWQMFFMCPFLTRSHVIYCSNIDIHQLPLRHPWLVYFCIFKLPRCTCSCCWELRPSLNVVITFILLPQSVQYICLEWEQESQN